MSKVFFFILGTFISINLLAIPAARNPKIDYRSYIKALAKQLPSEVQSKSAHRNRSSLDQIDFSEVPDYGSYEKVRFLFERLRDERFLPDPEFQKNLRRSSWLYPQDGCFARAQIMIENLEHLQLQAPKKIFIFGNLNVNTDYSSSGSVSWWYHVAPLLRVGQSLYVLDPAINPMAPTDLLEWIELQQVDTQKLSKAEFSLCNSDTYAPSSNCAQGDSTASKRAYRDQARYLKLERRNLKGLGKSEKELAESPPWKN